MNVDTLTPEQVQKETLKALLKIKKMLANHLLTPSDFNSQEEYIAFLDKRKQADE